MRTKECSQRKGICGAGAGVDVVKVEGGSHARSCASSIEPMRMKGPGTKEVMNSVKIALKVRTG